MAKDRNALENVKGPTFVVKVILTMFWLRAKELSLSMIMGNTTQVCGLHWSLVSCEQFLRKLSHRGRLKRSSECSV